MSPVPIVNEDDFRTYYSNYLAISLSPDDFRIWMGRVDIHSVEDTAVRGQAAVFIPPTLAIRLHKLLGQKLKSSGERTLEWLR